MAHRWSEPFATDVPGGRDFEPFLFGDRPISEAIRRARTWLMVAGVLALFIGAAAVAVPLIASVAITLFIGWVLVVAGVVAGVHAISHRASLRGLDAALTLVAGLYLLIFPLSGTVSLTFVLAVWFCASGVLSLVAAIRRRDAPDMAMTAFGGVISLILGVLIAVNLPSSAAWAIGLLVGINLIFWGVRALVGAHALKLLLDQA
ncbi:MAG TPA: DUF308 domain-containing protein [Solirubrobacteraceae bacterium]|jgi:uncharacterized membrane protein HdeD (DUF308 family)|nr:DUF308 domain-containing protein [Solirubrobacteraceae bacterium]